jgi:hypothetical protein
MKLLLFHGFLPTSPIFWAVVLAFIGFSIFLVLLGIVHFTKSDRKSALVLQGMFAFLILMPSYFLFDPPILPTIPFGLAAGIIPYIALIGYFDPGPYGVENPLVTHLPTVIGCVMNIIAMFTFAGLITHLYKRAFGMPVRSSGRSPIGIRLD